MAIRLKRAYEPPAPEDGERYLVERLWPRGVAKAELALTGWLKDLAPSTELRKWYGHEPGRRAEFVRKYRSELAAAEKQAALSELARKARAREVTLVFSTKETRLSGAVVLQEVLSDLASAA